MASAGFPSSTRRRVEGGDQYYPRQNNPALCTGPPSNIAECTNSQFFLLCSSWASCLRQRQEGWPPRPRVPAR